MFIEQQSSCQTTHSINGRQKKTYPNFEQLEGSLRLSVQEKLQRWKIHQLGITFFFNVVMGVIMKLAPLFPNVQSYKKSHLRVWMLKFW